MRSGFKTNFVGLAALAAVASLARATPVPIALPAATTPYSFPVSSTDLFESATVSSTGNFIHEGSSGPSALHDGVFQINGGNPANNVPLTTPDPNATVTFTLDTSINTQGYNLSNIVTYGGWNDSGRDELKFAITYTKVGSATQLPLDSVDFNPSSPTGISPVMVIFADPVTNVSSVTFTFGNAENGYSGYGEIDATGVAATPEPATLGLISLGSLSLLARRRR